MNIDQESNLVLSVNRGQNQQWHVSAQDLRQPLATFDNPQAACAWAVALAKPRQGRVFVEELTIDETSSRQERREASEFKFSIPVAWTESRESRLKPVRR